MKSIKVRYLGLVKNIVKKSEESIFLEGEANKLADVLKLLKKKYGNELTYALQTRQESLRNNVVILLNGENVTQGNAVTKTLTSGSTAEILIFNAVGGG